MLVHEAACRPPRPSSASGGSASIATGLTFLETIANPYTTVLGASATPPRASIWPSRATASAGFSGPIIGSMFFYSKDAAGPQHRQPDALDSLRRRWPCVVMVLAVDFLLRRGARHQDRGRLPPGRRPARRFAFHLVAPALRDGGGGAVLLRRRAGRHLQLLHQLHDRRSPRIPDSWRNSLTNNWTEVKTTFTKEDIQDLTSFVNKLNKQADPVSKFIVRQMADADEATSAGKFKTLESYDGKKVPSPCARSDAGTEQDRAAELRQEDFGWKAKESAGRSSQHPRTLRGCPSFQGNGGATRPPPG